MIRDLFKCIGVIAAFATIGPLVLWVSEWED